MYFQGAVSIEETGLLENKKDFFRVKKDFFRVKKDFFRVKKDLYSKVFFFKKRLYILQSLNVSSIYFSN